MADIKTNIGTRVGRSPSYPGCSLPVAIDKAQLLYSVQRGNAVSIEAALEPLGYKTLNGASQRTIAALISYGLLSEEGSGSLRKVKITDLARKILLLPSSDPDHQTAIKEAGRNPKIYQDMLTAWPESLPSDTEIRKYLTFTKSYHEDATPALIRDFKTTYEFAELGNRGTITSSQADNGQRNNDHASSENGKSEFAPDFISQVFPPLVRPEKEVDKKMPPPTSSAPPPAPQGFISYTLPIKNRRRAMLYAPDDLSAEDFDLLHETLKTLKKSLGDNDEPSGNTTAEHPLIIQTGPAIWRTKDADQPVIVSGYQGQMNGRHFVSIEGANSGIPLDELVYGMSLK